MSSSGQRDREPVRGPLRILALGHEASRSGAPLIHLGWLRWAARRPERFKVHSVLIRGGALLAEWPQLSSVTLLSRMVSHCGPYRRLFLKFLDRPYFLRSRFRRLWTTLSSEGVDVVLVNSQAAGCMVPVLGRNHPPVVLHSHELAGYSNRFVHPADRRYLREHVAVWIAVSEAGGRHVIDNWAVAGSKVKVIRNFVLPVPGLDCDRFELRRQLAVEHGLPGDRVWVLAVGGLDPVKGPEVFIEVASEMATVCPGSVLCIWIGGGVDGPYGRALLRLPGASNVCFLGARTDVGRWLAAADMMLLSSIEESSSLAVLEAAQLGTPVIAFRGTGGPDEMLDDGGGQLVPDRTGAAMAQAVRRWLDHPQERASVAAVARERVRKEADYERQCEKIAGVLESVVREPTT